MAHKKKMCSAVTSGHSLASGVYSNSGGVIKKIPVGFAHSKKTVKGK